MLNAIELHSPGHPSAGHVDGTEGPAVTLPEGISIEGAEYARQGPDLLLTTAEGETVLVRDFFAGAEPPALVTADGARIAPETAVRLAGPAAPGQVAQAAPAATAAEAIGQVDTVDGTVTITRADGTQITASQGMSVFQGDIIATGEGAAIGVVLADDTTFSMGEEGRMTLDELVYDPDTQEGSALLSLLEGSAVVVSGQIAKTNPDAMALSTPVGTIGIRGTSFTVKWDGTDFTLINMPEIAADGSVVVGEITFVDNDGNVLGVLNQSNQGWRWKPADAETPKVTAFTDEEVEAFTGDLIEALPTVPGGATPEVKARADEAAALEDELTTAAGDDEVVGDGGDLPEFVESELTAPDAGPTGPVIGPVALTPAGTPGGAGGSEPTGGTPQEVTVIGTQTVETVAAQFGHAEGSVFLQGTYLEVGLNNQGATIRPSAPEGFHPTDSGGTLGFVADLNGFVSQVTETTLFSDGSQTSTTTTNDTPDSPVGDFTEPGSSVDNVSVGWWYYGEGKHTDSSLTEISNSDDSDAVSVAESTSTSLLKATTVTRSTDYAGGELTVTQVTSFMRDATYMQVEVTLTNTGTSLLEGVRYMRNIDPDQDVDGTADGSFSTVNDVLANPSGGDHAAVVQATGEDSGISINFVAFDQIARASAFGFSNTDPFNLSAYDTPADPNGDIDDIGINLAFDVGDLGSGESATFTYYWAVDGSSDIGPGHDLRVGSAGGDSISGEAGNDILAGLGGNDTLLGGADDDVLNGGTGNDVLAGGDGVDTADYRGAASGVTVDLSTDAAQDTGGAGIDTLLGIENLTGSANADTLSGDDGANAISGGAGNDSLYGGGGGDVLAGGAGADTFRFTAASDGAAAGANSGYDRITDFLGGTDTFGLDGAFATAIDDLGGPGTLSWAVDTAADFSSTHEALLLTTAAGIGNADLVAGGFADVLAAINASLSAAGSGSDALIAIQATGGDTGIYYYQENGATPDAVDESELSLVAVVEDQALGTADFALPVGGDHGPM